MRVAARAQCIGLVPDHEETLKQAKGSICTGVLCAVTDGGRARESDGQTVTKAERASAPTNPLRTVP